MKHKFLIIGLLALLTACNKQESQPLSENTHTTQTPTVVDKAIQKASENSEVFKKSTQISDIFALQSAMEKAGIKQEDGIKWQTRLAQAQNNQEVKAILQEQFNAITAMKKELQRIKLHSQEVNEIRNELINGAEIVLAAEQKLISIDFNDPKIQEKITPVNNDIAKGGTIIFEANERFMALVKSLGFATNDEAKQYYEHYKGQFEQFKQNAQ